MIAFVDAHYTDSTARVACVLARNWDDECPLDHWVVDVEHVADYAPGEFYRRELPCILAVLNETDLTGLNAVVVDGYVWLSEDAEAGLGAHLREALEQKVAVVGVAKSPYRDAERFACTVTRGDSARPLWVTAAGIDPETAAVHVAGMHGPYRIPTLLRLVDRLCRGDDQGNG